MEYHKGGAHHTSKAREQLILAYKNLLKAAEKNDTFEYKNSIKREILETAKDILPMLESRALS